MLLDGPTAFVLSLAGAHLAAWLVMGANWRAAFLSPFGVLIPGCALILTHATMFENFMALPDLFIVVAAFQFLLLFFLLCARIAVAANAQDRPGAVAAKPAQRPKHLRKTYLIRELDERGQPLREWRLTDAQRHRAARPLTPRLAAAGR